MSVHGRRRVWRDGATTTIPVTLGTLPGDPQAKADSPAARGEEAHLSALGMTLVPSSAVPGGGKAGVTVAEVDPEGTAAQKGLAVGDVILAAGG